MNKLKKVLNERNFHKALKISALCSIVLYLLLFSIAFARFNSTVGSYFEQADFEDGMMMAVEYLGIIFLIPLATYGFLKFKNKIFSSFIVIVLAIFQIAYLGLPGSEEITLGELNFLSGHRTLRWALEDLKHLAIVASDSVSEFHCNAGIVLINILEIVMVISAILAILTLVTRLIEEIAELSKRIKGLEVEEVKAPLKSKAKKHTKWMRLANAFIPITLIIYMAENSMREYLDYLTISEIIEFREYYWLLRLVIFGAIPFGLFLIVVVDEMIKHEQYIRGIIAYILYMVALHGAMYWMGGWSDGYNDTNYMVDIITHYSFIGLGICMMIAGMVWNVGKKHGKKLASKEMEANVNEESK